MRISYPKTDPLLRSSMRQASFKCEAPRLELKSSRSFLAIKRCQRTKSKKVINWSWSSLKSWAHIIMGRNTTLRVRAGTKNSRPVVFYCRNSTGIPSITDTTPPTNIINMVCRLPPLRRGIFGYTQSDAGNLFGRGWARTL
jgi:hypothetical protein